MPMRRRPTSPRPEETRTTSPDSREDLRCLSDEELGARILSGLDAWSEIQEALLATGGMPPTRELAAKLTQYLEGSYRLGEEARVEVLHRQCSRTRVRPAERTHRGWSLT